MPVLMMIGPVRFEIAPFNASDISHGHESTIVEKPVLGTRPPLEWVGEGPESWQIRGRLFPERLGGLGTLALLQEARKSGLPQYMMRGDGTLMGWVLIEKVNEQSSYLDASGVGKVIDFDLSVKRCASPAAGQYFSIMEAIFR